MKGCFVALLTGLLQTYSIQDLLRITNPTEPTVKLDRLFLLQTT